MEFPPCCQLLSRESSKKAPLVIVMEKRAWHEVKSHVMDKVCMRILVPTIFFVSWWMRTENDVCCSWLNCVFSAACLYALMLILLLSSAVEFREQIRTWGVFGSQISGLHLFWSLYQTTPSLNKEQNTSIMSSAGDPLKMQEDPSQSTILINKSCCKGVISLFTNICLTFCDFFQRQAL